MAEPMPAQAAGRWSADAEEDDRGQPQQADGGRGGGGATLVWKEA